GLGLQRLLIGHNECGQTVDHGVEDVRGYDAVAQQLLAPLCPCQCHLFASWICPANVGCWYGSDCIHSTLRHATGAKAGHTVGIYTNASAVHSARRAHTGASRQASTTAPEGCTAQAAHREQEPPGGRTRAEQRPQRC